MDTTNPPAVLWPPRPENIGSRRVATRRGIAALALIIALSGCGQRHSAEEAVRRSLKDPDSARFGSFYFNKKTNRGCIAVNAKNGMGGYVGERIYDMDYFKGEWLVGMSMPVDMKYCQEEWADKAGE